MNLTAQEVLNIKNKDGLFGITVPEVDDKF